MHKLIEKYFDQKLEGKELKEFNRRLEEDTAFAKAFQVEKDVMDGLEAMGNQQLKKDLHQIYHTEILQKENKPTQVRSIRQNRWWWVAAAAISGLVLLGWWWNSQSIAPAALYAQYAQHDFEFTQKGTADQLLSAIETTLNQAAYDEAIPLLNEYLPNHPNDFQALLAKGIAHLELDETEKAILIFQQITKINAVYEVEGNWYLALTYLKKGDLINSQQYLEKIPSHSARYAQAQDLLKQF